MSTATASEPKTKNQSVQAAKSRLPLQTPDTEPDPDVDAVGYLLFHAWRPLGDPRSRNTRWRDTTRPMQDVAETVETKIGEKKVGDRIEPIMKRQLKVTPRGASMSRDEAVNTQVGRAYAAQPDFLRCRVMVYQDKPGGVLLGQSLDFPSIKTSSEHANVKHREFEVLTALRKALSEMLFEHRLAGTQPQWHDHKQPVPVQFRHADNSIEQLPLSVMVLDIPRE